jgi:hypothetical protein
MCCRKTASTISDFTKFFLHPFLRIITSCFHLPLKSFSTMYIYSNLT